MTETPEVTALPDIDKERIKKMIGTWFQTSRSYRHVCRLPDGKTGKQALAEAGDDWTPTQVENMGELNCGDQFLRVYTGRLHPAMHLTMGNAEFQYYRSIGGGTYRDKGPAKSVNGQKWKLTLASGYSTHFDVAIVSAENPDAAVAAVFSPHWKVTSVDTETGKSMKMLRPGFCFQSPNSDRILVVREVLKDEPTKETQ